ncbi:MAG: alpha-ketoacid dehydrogenase subunit beta [Gammaproteobacteria bacterium]|nr:alpha-ketoacid dehydrogenase subunit beta [Gammaproteobacteria bacterium]
MPHPESQRKIAYTKAIHEALTLSMQADERVILVGEGVPDPKGIFGTTLGLREKFGKQRVFDMPLSENGMTGICIGAALTGMRPVMVHQRVDFALLAMDQLVNNAAKWSYMFDGRACVPLTVRLIIGRGWGQGPQHSQSLQTLFAHIPGLKVAMPATAYDAKGMLISAIEDNNPVIFIEHRWVHGLEDTVPEEMYRVPLDKARVVRKGNALTLACFSYMLLEALKAAEKLSDHGIDVEIVDMRSARPLDEKPVVSSVQKTGRLLVLDTGWKTGGIGNEVIVRVMEQAYASLKTAPARIASPDHPVPTSHFLANEYYPGADHIAAKVLEMIEWKDQRAKTEIINGLVRPEPRDVPDYSFTGPF